MQEKNTSFGAFLPSMRAKAEVRSDLQDLEKFKSFQKLNRGWEKELRRSMAEEHIQVSTTTEKRKDAERIAQMLVQNRLAGCVQIVGPISSTYWWKGKMQTAEEWLCLIKSRKGLFKMLEKTVKEVHPYKTPEITLVRIVGGSKEYLQWLDRELRKEP
jgi:periplasmic divalent cation tolerance protein